MVEIIGPIKARGEFIDVTENVNLTVLFKDQNGNATNTDSFPTISIIEPSGLVLLQPTSSGVANVGTGQYSYIFTVPPNGPYGVFNDVWTATINGFSVSATFSFVVSHSEMPSPNLDGYFKLGDDVGFNYSQTAIYNIIKLIKMLKGRLNSSGKSRKVDAYGNVEYLDCDIYSIETLTTFIATALSDFNQVPFFTFITFDQTQFIDQFAEVLVEGATLYALASMALIERGSEFNITDQGLNFQPPTVSELLNTQYNTLLTHYWEKLKMIKASLRPYPSSLGVFSMTTGNGLLPSIRNLGRLRERRIL